jgi:succinoglycan biosynthesis protein ExoM
VAERRPEAVTIGVVTFRRPDDLAALLPLLLEQAAAVEGPDRTVDVLVVDNDPAQSARPVVETLAAERVRYVPEPVPGIAAARNRVLDETAADLLVFIDDDERPQAGWLAALLATRAATGAVAVAGAVVSAFDGDLDPWVQAGAFFRSRLLAPSDYGLLAMVTAVIAVADIFRDLGLSTAAVQAPRLTAGQRANLFWINSGVGLLLSLAAFAAAPLLAAVYGRS